MPRKKSPFALNKTDIEILTPVVSIIEDISIRYPIENSNHEKADTTDDTRNIAFISACKKNNIDTKKILAIYKKVSNSKWYSYFIQDVIDDAVMFALIVSDDPEKVKPITPDEYPVFFSLFNSQNQDQMDAVREALHISDEYRFLNISHYEAIYSTAENYIKSGPRYKSTGGHTIRKMLIPLDKASRKVMSLSYDQMNEKLPIRVEREGDKHEINTIIMFSALSDALKKAGLEKIISGYDMLVCLFTDALTKAGNETVSYGQLYRAMYGGTQGGKTDYDRIDESLTKCGSLRLYLDNQEEHNAYSKYKRIEYDAPFLPFERVREKEYKNGKIADACIRLYREWPLLSYAIAHGQFTEADVRLFQAPVSKTDNNIRVNIAMVIRLLAVKNGKRMKVKKMLYETIADEAGITDKQSRRRIKTPAIKYMEYFKTRGFILDFIESADGRGIDFAVTDTDVKRIQKERTARQNHQKKL